MGKFVYYLPPQPLIYYDKKNDIYKIFNEYNYMNLILFRHGPPIDSIEWSQRGKKESERPLTEGGVQVTKKASEGLKTALDVSQEEILDCSIYSSPYTRALQTANILKDTLQIKEDVTVLEELTPDSHP